MFGLVKKEHEDTRFNEFLQKIIRKVKKKYFNPEEIADFVKKCTEKISTTKKEVFGEKMKDKQIMDYFKEQQKQMARSVQPEGDKIELEAHSHRLSQSTTLQ